jgi:hypothetical protein
MDGALCFSGGASCPAGGCVLIASCVCVLALWQRVVLLRSTSSFLYLTTLWDFRIPSTHYLLPRF